MISREGCPTMPKYRPADDMLADLEQELARGRVIEAPLRKDGPHHLEGLYDSGTGIIRVNPRPAVVECLLHELVHRRYPQWSEWRVQREGRRLLTALDDAGVDKWYRAYQKAKRVSKKRVGLDEE